MEALFLKVLSMSAIAAVVVLVVLLARLPLRRAPKVFSYALWTVVLFRLLCPLSFESAFSVLPAVQSQPTADGQRVAHVYTGVAVVNSPVNDYLSGHPYPADLLDGPAPGADTAEGSAAVDWMTAAVAAWLAGAAILLGYSVLSMLRLRRKLVGSVPLEGEKDVRLADHIPSAFVLGLFRPKIYLPSDLPEGERDYVLLHERTHIRRFDHVFRALAWLALAIHWFNPLVWLAFHLAGKDMEMSCDEAVLRKMGRDVRADYSSSLLRLSTGKRLPAGPLAFGDGDPTSRIKNVLSYKKPALWVIVIALIGVVCAGVALATDRMAAIRDSDVPAFDPDSVDADLTFALNHSDAGRPYVHMSGTVLGHTVEDATWWPPYGSGEAPYVGYRGLMMEYTFESKGDRAYAWWTDESRTSVTVSTKASVNGVSMPMDWWEFTVDLSGRQGTVTSMETKGREGARSAPFMTIPEAISDEEAIKVARIAAKLMTAAEDWYLQQPVPSTDLAANLIFSLDETDEELGPVVRMDGTVGDVTLPRGAFWRPKAVWSESPLGELTMVYPAFSDGIEGHVTAWWADESRTSVTLSTHMMAMFSSYLPTGYWIVTVNVDNGTLTELTPSNLTTIVGNEDAEVRLYPSSISVKEAAEAARVAAKLLTAAEDYYNNGAPVQTLPEGDVWMEVWTATPTSLECFIGNQSGKALLFREDYRLQTEVGGVWRDVEEETPMDFVASARVLDGSEGQLQLISVSFPVDVGSRYGELPPGHYRILKEAHLERELEREAVTLSAEFEIEG